jgi:hypothetical protein
LISLLGDSGNPEDEEATTPSIITI